MKHGAKKSGLEGKGGEEPKNGAELIEYNVNENGKTRGGRSNRVERRRKTPDNQRSGMVGCVSHCHSQALAFTRSVRGSRRLASLPKPSLPY